MKLAIVGCGFLGGIVAEARRDGLLPELAASAIGGFEVLCATALMSAIEASITSGKGPQSLCNTPVFNEGLLNASEAREMFAGNAIALFSTKVNVCGRGDRARHTRCRGDLGQHQQHIRFQRSEVHVEEVLAVVDIYSLTRAVAGWSVAALLCNLVATIAF